MCVGTFVCNYQFQSSKSNWEQIINWLLLLKTETLIQEEAGNLFRKAAKVDDLHEII